MNKAQAVADISFQLSKITTPDNAIALIQRALRVTGLSNVNTLSQDDVNALLSAIAAEGGLVQEIAERIAINGLPSTSSLSGPGGPAAA